MVLRELIQTNFAPAIGMFFTIFFLIGDKNLSRKHKFFFWSAVAACITELIATNIELSLAAPNTTFIRWRIFGQQSATLFVQLFYTLFWD